MVNPPKSKKTTSPAKTSEQHEKDKKRQAGKDRRCPGNETRGQGHPQETPLESERDLLRRKAKSLKNQKKKDILARSKFRVRLCLLAIDEIHLTEERGKKCRPRHAKISKVRNEIAVSGPIAAGLVRFSLSLLPLAFFLLYSTFSLLTIDLPRICQCFGPKRITRIRKKEAARTWQELLFPRPTVI